MLENGNFYLQVESRFEDYCPYLLVSLLQKGQPEDSNLVIATELPVNFDRDNNLILEFGAQLLLRKIVMHSGFDMEGIIEHLNTVGIKFQSNLDKVKPIKTSD